MRQAHCEDDSGTLEASEPRPGILSYTVEGKLTTGIMKRIIEFAEASKVPELSFFHDWWNVQSYDTQARLLIVRWSTRNRARIRAAHIVTHSKIVKMGVAVGNLTLGGIATLHETPAAFRQALTRAKVGD